MKDLIFVFGMDIGYGVEEAYLEPFKCKNLMEAIDKLIKKANEEESTDEPMELKDFVEDEYIDLILVINPETGNQVNYIDCYVMPSSIEGFQDLSKEIENGFNG